jgi:hypothetical protein
MLLLRSFVVLTGVVALAACGQLSGKGKNAPEPDAPAAEAASADGDKPEDASAGGGDKPEGAEAAPAGAAPDKPD